MAPYCAVRGSIWRRSGGVSNLVRGNFVSRSFSSVSSGRMSPWLMLPPAKEDGSMVYKFFSLAENRELSFNWGAHQNCSDFDPNDKDAQLVGSSKGWLGLMNNRTRQMILINPLTRRHLKLPSLHSLEVEPPPVFDSPSKIILSTSPDDDDEGGGECRALLGYPSSVESLRSVFVESCCPSRSYTWDTMGEHLFSSIAYSKRQKLFFCLESGCEMQAWDLRDTLSPKMMTQMDLPIEIKDDRLDALLGVPNEDTADFLRRWPSYLLVVNKDTDDLFVVTRFFIANKMILDVHRYDPNSATFQHMDRTLGGLSFFIDDNMNAFAVSAEEFPGLKPDSIYFVLNDDNWWSPEGQNVGIYNYKDATISPLCDLPGFSTFKPALGWFTPNTSN